MVWGLYGGIMMFSVGILGRDMRVLLMTMGLCEVLAWLWGRSVGF